jgi:hypothetical protein
VTADPTRPLPEWWNTPPPPGTPPPARRRRKRWPLITVVTVLVILALLVVLDFAAKAYTENQMASQFQSSVGLSGKPDVNIEGFPFLTQLASRDFHTVNITATNETVTASSLGSGTLQIASLDATLHGVHIHGTNSATVNQFNATALITLTALANAGGVPSGVTLAPAGSNQIKATVNILGLFSDTATVQVTQTGPDQINVKVIDFGGIPTNVLGNLANFNVTLPKLPAGVTIKSVSVTQQGLQVTAAGQNTTLSQ